MGGKGNRKREKEVEEEKKNDIHTKL